MITIVINGAEQSIVSTAGGLGYDLHKHAPNNILLKGLLVLYESSRNNNLFDFSNQRHRSTVTN